MKSVWRRLLIVAGLVFAIFALNLLNREDNKAEKTSNAKDPYPKDSYGGIPEGEKTFGVLKPVQADTPDTGEGCGCESLIPTAYAGEGCCCFRGRTYVATAKNQDGTISYANISKLKKGDLVLGVDHEYKGFGKRAILRQVRVTQAYHFPTAQRSFISVTTASGSTIESTATHPFVTNEKGGYARAYQLSAGMAILAIYPQYGLWGRWKRLEPILHRSNAYADRDEVFHLKTESENFLVSKDGKTFFLVLNSK